MNRNLAEVEIDLRYFLRIYRNKREQYAIFIYFKSLFIALYRLSTTNIYFHTSLFFPPSIHFFRPTRSRLQFAPSRSPASYPAVKFNSRACLPRAPNYLLTRHE
jgi:hypothetical protein